MTSLKIKDSFIQTKKSSQHKPIQLFFDKAKEYEDRFGKDLCDFQLEEILLFFKGLNLSNISSLRIRASYARTYTDYCIASNYSLDNQNHFDEVTTAHLESCVNENKEATFYLVDREVQDLIKEVSDDRDIFLILGLYEGVGSREIIDLTEASKNDLKKENQIQLQNGEYIDVSPVLYEAAIEAVEAEGYRTRNGKLFKYKTTSKNILKTTGKGSESIVSKPWIIKQLDMIKTNYDIPTLGMHMLNESGFLNQLHSLVIKYKDIDLALDSEQGNKICKQHTITKTRIKIKQLYDSFLKYNRDKIDEVVELNHKKRILSK